MIIRNIKQESTKSLVRISADILMRGENKPQQIFFECSKKEASSLIVDATPFVAAMLIPCLKNNENITVENSTISEAFAKNIKTLMSKLARWDEQFHRIKIVAETKKDTAQGKETASFFSGGVDSFYTYIKAKRSKKTKISTFLFVHGFDIELENTSFFKSVKRGLEKIAAEEGVELITLRTNSKRISERYVEWDWGHGGALASIALLLRKKIKTVYIAGALSWEQLFPYGTHPEIDPLWGTETLKLIHDGNEYDRLDKVVKVVGKSPLALKHLRVCNQNLKGKHNCSHCFKCLWTMMTLECAKSLDKAQTFEHEIDLEAVKRMRYTFERNYHMQGLRVIDSLQKQNRRADIQEAVLISLERSKHPSVKQRIAMKVADFDKKYNKRRLYMAIFALNNQQDRGTLFKLLAKQGIIK